MGKIVGDLVVTGISDHAQDALGDLVYVEMPEVGSQITAGAQAGVVESVKLLLIFMHQFQAQL